MATPVRIIITAAILLATMGISHAQDKPKSKVLRIGLPVPYFIENPAQDEEPLALEFLTDLVLGTYSQNAVSNHQTKEEPLYFEHQRVFPAFSIAQERDGGKIFYAELKPNVFFHDDSIATLDDVEFSLSRHPERSPATQRVKFTKLSPHSFTLSSDRLENWMWVWGTPLRKRAGVGEKSISAGPYIVTDVDRKKRRVRLKAFEKYINGPPLAPEAEYTFYDNSEKAMFGFLADETDFVCGLKRGQEKMIGKIPGTQVVQLASENNFKLTFNLTKPPMDDILVRKAVSLLIDRVRLVSKSESLQGSAIPTQYQFAMSSPLTKAHADPPDPVGAFKLLQKAGYTRTAKGWEKDGKPISISMKIPDYFSSYIPELRIVARWLTEAGLNANFELAKTSSYKRTTNNEAHILFTGDYDKLDFENNFVMFEPAGRSNLSQSTDPTPAILLAGAKSGSLTPEAKNNIIKKIADYHYSAPLFYPVEYCAGKSNTGYENAFFKSPFVYSAINRNAPSGLLRGQTGPRKNVR